MTFSTYSNTTTRLCHFEEGRREIFTIVARDFSLRAYARNDSFPPKSRCSTKPNFVYIWGFISIIVGCIALWATPAYAEEIYDSITVVAGSSSPSYNRDNIPATSARLGSPSDVAIDAAGNLYIADTQNHRIRKVDAATGTITTVAGNGSPGYGSDGVQASASRQSHLSTPITGWFTTTSLPEPVAGQNAVAYDADGDGHDDTLFLVGGRDASGGSSDRIYAASFDTDGSISGWNRTSSLPEPLYLHSLSATETHLIVIGGWKANESSTLDRPSDAVWTARISESGTINNWRQEASYPTAVDLHSSVVVGNSIYSIGGWDTHNKIALDSVYSALIHSDGSITNWIQEPSLPVPLRRTAAVAFNNRIYVIGGADTDGSAYDSVYAADVLTDGSLSPWQLVANLPNPLFYHRALIHDGTLVILGGLNDIDGPALDNVYSAVINSDGSLGVWTAESPLPQGLYRFAAVSLNRSGSDYAVVVGGFMGDSSAQSTVYHSDLPSTPVVTSTPIVTVTPVPHLWMDVKLDSNPQRWIAPGEEITYTIRYTNTAAEALSNTFVEGLIPENTEFVVGSANPALSTPIEEIGTDNIQWELGSVASGEAGTLHYSVRRPLPTATQSDVPQVLGFELSGPVTGTIQEPLTYTLHITNQSVIPLTSAIVTINFSPGVTHIGSSPEGTVENGNLLSWTAPTLGPWDTHEFEFTLVAESSFVLYNNNVETAEDVRATAQDLLVEIDDTPVQDPGDEVRIVNEAVVRWEWADNVYHIPAEISNPPLPATPINTPIPTSTPTAIATPMPTATPTSGPFSVDVSVSVPVTQVTVGDTLTVTTQLDIEANGCMGGIMDQTISGMSDQFIPISPTRVAANGSFVLQAKTPGTATLCVTAFGDHRCGSGGWEWHYFGGCSPPVTVIGTGEAPVDSTPSTPESGTPVPTTTTGPPPAPPTITPMPTGATLDQPANNRTFLPFISESQ